MSCVGIENRQREQDRLYTVNIIQLLLTNYNDGRRIVKHLALGKLNKLKVGHVEILLYFITLLSSVALRPCENSFHLLFKECTVGDNTD